MGSGAPQEHTSRNSDTTRTRTLARTPRANALQSAVASPEDLGGGCKGGDELLHVFAELALGLEHLLIALAYPLGRLRARRPGCRLQRRRCPQCRLYVQFFAANVAATRVAVRVEVSETTSQRAWGANLIHSARVAPKGWGARCTLAPTG